MVPLTEHQRQALDAYVVLMEQQPQLFSGRIARPIVRDRALLEAYMAENNVVLGVAADTPYILFVVDLVESPVSGGGVHRYPYMRVVSRAQLRSGVNVVILATIENPALGPRGSVVLIDQERHALGTCVTELPRGFGEPGVSGEKNALRELEEETGFVGESAHLMAITATDSGITDSQVSFYHIPVVQSTSSRREVGEAIRNIHLLPRQEVWKRIHSGELRDGFTLQALALFETQSGVFPNAS